MQHEPTIMCHCGRQKNSVADAVCLVCLAIHAKYSQAARIIRAEKAKFNASAAVCPVYHNGYRIVSVGRTWILRGYDTHGNKIAIHAFTKVAGMTYKQSDEYWLNVWKDLLDQANLPYVAAN